MRFEALHLERYGAFEDVTFDFGGKDVRLHVIFGPNEAGKSTVLSAISDLLFGIPTRTAYNFRFEYSKLRIGAEITNAAGTSLAFKRRKANNGTLLTFNGAETILPDSVLTPFVQGMSRELFTRMFALDHSRLREGGEQMLRSGGDLARSLFEAGSGLSGVGAILQSIEAEIDSLGDLERRARTKPLWREVNSFEDAVQSVRRDGLKIEEWRQAEQALEQARAERLRVDEALIQLRKRRAQLERVRRVAPLLAAIDLLSAQLEGFGDLPALPPEFAEEWRRKDQNLREARLILAQAEEVLQERTEELEPTPTAGPILDFADRIEALHEEIGRYLKGVADEPKLARDIASDEALIRHHLQSLGSSADPATVEGLVPSMPLVARIRELVRQGESIETTARVASTELRKAQDAYRLAQEKLAGLPAVVDPAPAAALIEEVSRLGDLATRAARAERDLAAADRDLAEGLKRLPHWADNAEALAARAFPDVESARLHEDKLRQAHEDLVAATRIAEEKSDEIRRVEADLAGLAAVGEVPSPAAVRTARDQRDWYWRVIRARHIEGREPAAEDCAGIDALDDLASRYETALRHADELVDRRESDAHRIARFSELTAQLMRLHRQQESVETKREQARQALETAEVSWRSLWAESGILPGPVSSMQAWLAQKDEVLRLLSAARKAHAELEEVVASSSFARAILTRAAEALGRAADPSLTLADLTRIVRQQVSDTQRAWQAQQTAAQKVADEKIRVQDKEAVEKEAQATAAEWRSNWAAAVVQLGLPVSAGNAEAEAALTAWDEIRQRLTNKAQTVRRLAGIRKDNEDFRNSLIHLVQALGPDAIGLDPGQDPEGTVRMLVSRLSTARENATRRAQVVKSHHAAVAAAASARQSLDAAVRATEALRNSVGLALETDVFSVIDQVEARRRCADELADRRRSLAEASDGRAEIEVRQEVAAVTPDAAIAELATLNADEPRLVQESQAAAQQETSAQHALDALAGRKSVAAAAQQARHAAQAAGAHLDRWLRLTAAKRMLERALERYRTENQHPLVRRGSEIFASMAGLGDNPIIRLDVAYGDGSEPRLMGIRLDGSECPVDGMSEGTRDQLFLSLRIAAVEQHVAANGQMPFIADDLFITSDDERVPPGLAALAELGRSTQVILFTHHRSVVDAAGTLPAGTVKVHRLPASQPTAAKQAMAG